MHILRKLFGKNSKTKEDSAVQTENSNFQIWEESEMCVPKMTEDDITSAGIKVFIWERRMTIYKEEYENLGVDIWKAKMLIKKYETAFENGNKEYAYLQTLIEELLPIPELVN